MEGGIQKFWVAFGNAFPTNTVIQLLPLPTGKNINNGKILILKFWVERQPNERFDADCDAYKNNNWGRFHIYVNTSNILCIYFTSTPSNIGSWSRRYIINYIEFQ